MDGNERKKIRKGRIRTISTRLWTSSFPHPSVGHKHHCNHNLNEESLNCGVTEPNMFFWKQNYEQQRNYWFNIHRRLWPLTNSERVTNKILIEPEEPRSRLIG